MKGQKGFVHVHALPLQLPGFAWARGAAARIGRWRELARQRRMLATLSDSALDDLGLSRADISQEAERPFWDDPMHK